MTLTSLAASSSPSFSINLWVDLQQIFQFAFMQHAFEAGTVVAIVAGIVGYFVVLRRSSFAAHALSHIGFSGAAAAVLIGVNPVYGSSLVHKRGWTWYSSTWSTSRPE